MRNNKKVILVTGGAGFIGKHLCMHLCNNKNNYVICLDNLFSGQIENIIQLKSNCNFEFVRQDVCTPINLKIDEIYHLACPASPVYYQKQPVETIKTNVIGSLNVLELAYKNNAKVLLSSTSEVYGDPLQNPQDEKYWGNVNPVGIRSCYDEGKRCAETLFMDFHKQYNLKIKIARIFNTYGPNMRIDDGRVVSNFIVQALRKKNLTVYGSGNQKRSFCFIDDLVPGLVKLMDSDSNIYYPINLGNPESLKIVNLCKIIIKLTNSNSNIVFKKLPDDDPKLREPCIDLAKKVLDWKPKIKLNLGLLQTIKYFKQVL